MICAFIGSPAALVGSSKDGVALSDTDKAGDLLPMSFGPNESWRARSLSFGEAVSIFSMYVESCVKGPSLRIMSSSCCVPMGSCILIVAIIPTSSMR